MKKRILLTVAYDGTDFHGFAYQEGVRTVEGELARALKELTGEETEITGASRTDTGVHAYGNLASFDTGSSVPPERFALALDPFLPEDLRVISSEEVSADFHPRKTGWPKTYEYRILNTERPDPLLRRTTFHYRGTLDVEAMHEAAQYLAGTHDFTSFCSVHSLSPTRERTIHGISVFRRQTDMLPCACRDELTNAVPGEDIATTGGTLIIIRVTGSGFLYHMVRIIAGTLLDVGTGRLQPSDMYAILEARDRARAGRTAEPQGLILEGYQRKE
ncbi:MAG: tRNA pseudouridine(38-40) synthase TruA [Lachnospiraceae bacterium]|nr:tRNA pseudouridine(38-40) synthase TruA [Lachnospiraceae bacterium]